MSDTQFKDCFLLSACLVLPLGLPRLARIASLSLQPLQLFILREPKTTPELTLFEAFSLDIFVFLTQTFLLEEVGVSLPLDNNDYNTVTVKLIVTVTN